MPSGGARARSGPAPDPNALRRSRDGKDWTKLDPAGRRGRPAPPWPLPDSPEQLATIGYLETAVAEAREEWAAATDRRKVAQAAARLDKLSRELAVTEAVIAARREQELALWERLWSLPQAVVWEADRTHDHVALYCRAYHEAQKIGASANERTLAARLAGELLLTTSSLHAMRYVIDDAIGGAVAADLTGEKAARPSTSRNRFRVVREASDPEESA